jgi:general secretion pathway protein M
MRAWYDNLAERERRFVLYGGILAAVMILAGIIVPLNRDILQARTRIAAKQSDLAFIQNVTPQLQAAGPATAGGVAAESLVVLIDSSARESGLGKSLSSSQPTGDGGLRVSMDKVAFDAMLAWLARLSQQHGVRVETAEIEAAGENGLVNASLVLKTG